MIKKILMAFGIIFAIYFVLNLITINSNNVYYPKDGANIEVSIGAGNFQIDSGTQKGTVSTNLAHKLLVRPIVKTQEKYLGILTKSGSGKMELPKEVRFDKVSLVGGAGDFGFNLMDSNVPNLNITTGASNIVLFLPKDISSNINIRVGAGNLALKIPTSGKLEGIKIISSNLSNVDLSEVFEKTVDGVQSKEFEKAKVKSIINLTGSGSLQLTIDGI